jgi:hypothetical protein
LEKKGLRNGHYPLFLGSTQKKNCEQWGLGNSGECLNQHVEASLVVGILFQQCPTRFKALAVVGARIEKARATVMTRVEGCGKIRRFQASDDRDERPCLAGYKEDPIVQVPVDAVNEKKMDPQLVDANRVTAIAFTPAGELVLAQADRNIAKFRPRIKLRR